MSSSKLGIVLMLAALFCAGWADTSAESESRDVFQIEGRVILPEHDADQRWLLDARVIVTGAPTTHVGFLRADGTFVVSNLRSGSYMVEVANPRYHVESVRVDVSSRGKFRARKLNHIQPSEVVTIAYPLKMRTMGRVQYFMAREKWRTTDILLNPMVLMMVIPVLLIVVLPKMMNDPETKKEMEQLSLPKYDMPELSEMMTSIFGANRQQKCSKQKKKQN